MNKKLLTHVLIAVLLVNLGFRLTFIANGSKQLLTLLSKFLFSGDLFEAHILSHRSAFFWFHLIELLIPHIIILSLIAGVFNYFKSDKTVINRYLILGIILSYFSTLPDLIILVVGISKFSVEQYFLTNPVWAVSHYAGFIFAVFYFSVFQVVPGTVNVSENLKIRFKNYLIDTIYLLYLSLRLLQFIKGGDENHYFMVYGVTSILYFVYCEFLFGQSIGKTVTNTHVYFHGNRLAWASIRTLARKIPLEPLSFFLKGSAARWHDKLSKSHLTKI